MADIELEHDREGVHYRLADRVDIVALLAIERDVYNGDIPWTFSHFEHEIVKMMKPFHCGRNFWQCHWFYWN